MNAELKTSLCVMGLGLVIVIVGCSEPNSDNPTPDWRPAFWADRVQLQRSFTRIAEGNPQQGETPGIEVFVEVFDQFGDPIKAAGEFRFEIFRYVPAVSDQRGRRYEEQGMQEFDLTEAQINQQYWDSITLSYRMRLNLPPEATEAKHVVLQVTFISGPEDQVERVQDVLVLERK
ncbi:MAG: hypothetical protein GY869_05305 [Planctomycetes bacterium]|nr:hypothetical protein [Planctomycetota bacterium]